jgi:nucleoid DNA-binding protein
VYPARVACGEVLPAQIPEEVMAAKKAAPKSAAKSITKGALLQAVAEAVGEGTTKKQVVAVLDALAAVAHQELKKAALFTLPGFAKFRVIKKPATKARQGINPFTKQPQTFAAKPASKSVRARPIKAIKNAVA